MPLFRRFGAGDLFIGVQIHHALPARGYYTTSCRNTGARSRPCITERQSTEMSGPPDAG